MSKSFFDSQRDALNADSAPSDANRRRLLQALGAASVAGLPTWSFGQPTAAVNTTKLAITDTEVTVGQLRLGPHFSSGLGTSLQWSNASGLRPPRTVL